MSSDNVAQTRPAEGLAARMAAGMAVSVLLVMACLFIAAGRLDWLMGWLYVGVLTAMTAISRALMVKRQPDLVAERSRSAQSQNTKAWDKLISPLVAIVGPFASCVVAGLDQRFGWSPALPLALHIAGLLLVGLGYGLGIWAMLENKFFSAVVRIQTERGHHVVSSGPYRVVRHPGYVGDIVIHLAGAFALGSLWALIPAGLVVALTFVRTALEDRTLREELAGYAEYAGRVRYRLLPGVW